MPHSKDWLAALDNDWNIFHDYSEKARNLQDLLLKTTSIHVLLYCDLPHAILQNGEEWLVIASKSVIDAPDFENVLRNRVYMQDQL